MIFLGFDFERLFFMCCMAFDESGLTYIHTYIHACMHALHYITPRPGVPHIYIYDKGLRKYYTPTPVKLYIQLGRSTRVLGNIKLPPPLNFTFKWEDQQRYSGILQSHPR